MKLTDRINRKGKWVCRAPLFALLAAFFLAGYLPGDSGTKTADDKEKKKDADKAPPPVEVRFLDDSTMKLTLLDEKIELATPYGKLLIPAAEIRQIEFGWRLADDVAKRIEAAVADLGSSDFKKRQAATEELLALGEKAYPALLKASKEKDAEVQRRAEELLDKLREAVPEEKLEVRSHDVIHTEDSKIAGRITATSLKVKTFQFGEQQVKLTDVRSLRAPGAVEVEPANVQPDPGYVYQLNNNVGQSFYFRVTGALAGRALYGGPEVYTTDSGLAMAAVHSGILKAGQTGVVKVTILGPVAGFVGSTRNGITSNSYGGYPGFRISKVK